MDALSIIGGARIYWNGLDGTVLFLGPVVRVIASVAPKSKYWASGQDGQRLRPHEGHALLSSM
jgi:hypothetical protein